MCLPSPCGILPRACSEALRCKKEGCRITGILLCVIRMDTRLSTSSASKEAARLFAGRSEAPRHPRGGADRLSARDAPAHLQKTARASDRKRRRSFPATKKTASCPFYTTRKWSTAAAPSARQAGTRSSRAPRGFDESSREYLSHNHLRYFVSYTLNNRCILIAFTAFTTRQIHGAAGKGS